MTAQAVILAAGAGRRFGGAKLQAEFRGRPLLAWSLQSALAAPVAGVTLVLAPGSELGALAHDVHAAYRAAPPLGIVTAERAEEGMGASLCAGVASLPPDCAVLVFLADMPNVPTAIAGRLLDALDGGRDAAAPVYAGRRGHPVAFAPVLRSALLGLTGDSGARQVLAGLGARVALMETDDEGVLFDVDTREHLARGGLHHGS